MTLPEVTTILKTQFEEISNALYQGNLNIHYIEATDQVFGDASSQFNLVRFSESNFEFFYLYHKHLLDNLDIIELRDLKNPVVKLDGSKNLLSLDVIRQSGSAEVVVSNHQLFFDLNFAANLFVFFHEAGHTNQELAGETNDSDASHFSEYNSDYYAFSKILNYYHALRHNTPDEYFRRASAFGSEQHFIRCVIVSALTVVYLHSLSSKAPVDSATHPSIRKRFCHLLYQMQIQLEANFGFLFAHDSLGDFLVDIFTTMDFIEAKLFNRDETVFSGLLHYCTTCFDEVKEAMKHNDKFTRFNQ